MESLFSSRLHHNGRREVGLRCERATPLTNTNNNTQTHTPVPGSHVWDHTRLLWATVHSHLFHAGLFATARKAAGVKYTEGSETFTWRNFSNPSSCAHVRARVVTFGLNSKDLPPSSQTHMPPLRMHAVVLTSLHAHILSVTLLWVTQNTISHFTCLEKTLTCHVADTHTFFSSSSAVQRGSVWTRLYTLIRRGCDSKSVL